MGFKEIKIGKVTGLNGKVLGANLREVNAGSCRITIRASTFSELGSGERTTAMQFRQDDGTLRGTATSPILVSTAIRPASGASIGSSTGASGR